MLRHDFSAGVPGLFSGAGFDMAWTQYQSHLILKLNDLTAGKRTCVCVTGPLCDHIKLVQWTFDMRLR